MGSGLAVAVIKKLKAICYLEAIQIIFHLFKLPKYCLNSSFEKAFRYKFMLLI